MLLRLEEAGWVALPPHQRVKNNGMVKPYVEVPAYCHQPLVGRTGDYAPPVFLEARGADRYLRDYLVHHYHYLGYPKLVGEHLKQLVFIGGQVAGCLGWASAAWKIAPRDRHICWTAECQRTRLHLLANNVRFLILLGIQIRHLASQVLAMSVRGLSAGWTHRYGHLLYLAETFVDLPCAAWDRLRAMPSGRIAIIVTAGQGDLPLSPMQQFSTKHLCRTFVLTYCPILRSRRLSATESRLPV